MQLVLVSSGLRVISLGRTDGNAVLLVMPCSYSVLTGRSLSRDELMAEVGGCMEETAPAVAIPASVAGGTFCEVKNKPTRNHTLLKVWLCEVSPSRVGDLHFLGLGALPMTRLVRARQDNT